MSNAITIGSVWTHHRGQRYTVISLSNDGSTRPGFEPRVEYQRVDDQSQPFGPLYSRRRDEFLEKFTSLYVQYSSGLPPMDGVYACRVLDSFGYTKDSILAFSQSHGKWFGYETAAVEGTVLWIGPLSREKILIETKA